MEKAAANHISNLALEAMTNPRFWMANITNPR
jgi:hypothetical protein